MTAPRPGDRFHLDIDGTVIDGRYIEVDPPHRMVIGWDRQGTDDADFYGEIWRRYLDGIAARFAGPAPADGN
jgi:uncharacterized protein YndB with AHSA1/START domain